MAEAPLRLDEEVSEVVEELTDMPSGTIGFRIAGTITREDYEAILPRITEFVESTGEVRFLCEIGPEWKGMTSDAVWEDLKTALKYEVFQRAAWKRTAVVTDLDWVRRMIELLGWIVPGELKVFPHEELEAAKAWVAE